MTRFAPDPNLDQGTCSSQSVWYPGTQRYHFRWLLIRYKVTIPHFAVSFNIKQCILRKDTTQWSVLEHICWTLLHVQCSSMKLWIWVASSQLGPEFIGKIPGCPIANTIMGSSETNRLNRSAQYFEFNIHTVHCACGILKQNWLVLVVREGWIVLKTFTYSSFSVILFHRWWRTKSFLMSMYYLNLLLISNIVQRLQTNVIPSVFYEVWSSRVLQTNQTIGDTSIMWGQATT